MNGRIFMFLAIFFFISIHFYYYPAIPETMAIHFSFSGSADSWLSKEMYVYLISGVTLFVLLVFWGVGKMMAKLPDDLINVPNKKYWLAPERREQTIQDLRGDLNIIGAMTMLFLGLISAIVYRANLSEAASLDPGLFWPLLIGYIVLVIGYAIRRQLRYKQI